MDIIKMCKTIQENIYFWLVSCLLIISIILSAVNIKTHNLDKNFLDEIYENLKLKPISSIEVSYNENGCSSGKRAIVLDLWDGTIEGCDCRGQDSDDIPKAYRNQIAPIACTEDMLEEDCIKIPANPSKELTKWKDITICVEYDAMTYTDYLKNTGGSSRRNLGERSDDDDDHDDDDDSDDDKKKKCKDGYKRCGSMDNLEQELCIKDNLNCPINDIVINMMSSFTKDGITYDSKFLDKTLRASGMYLHSTDRAPKGQTIAKFKLSEGKVCAYGTEINSVYDPYILDPKYKLYNKCKSNDHSEHYDDRYNLVDSIDKESLFKQNNLYDIVSDLPDYPLNTMDASVELYSRSFFGYKKECLKDLNDDTFSMTHANDSFETNESIHIGLVVFLSLTFTLHVVFGLCQCCCCKEEKDQKCVMILYIIMLLCHVLNIGLAIGGFCTIKSLNFNKNCWDEETTFGIEIFTNTLKQSIDFDIVILSFALISILFIIVLMVILCLPKPTIKIETTAKDISPYPTNEIKDPPKQTIQPPVTKDDSLIPEKGPIKETMTPIVFETMNNEGPKRVASIRDAAPGIIPIETNESLDFSGTPPQENKGYQYNPNQQHPMDGMLNNYPMHLPPTTDIQASIKIPHIDNTDYEKPK